MKPPKNPLGGTRTGETVRKARRGLFVPKIRGRRRPGERVHHVGDPGDEALRGLGIPIHDGAARGRELGSYLTPRR